MENAWILLHQDNAPSHTAFITREFLAKNNITIIDHPPYSPDLAPCDFYLFPKVKNIMRDEHFVAVDPIKRETTKLLKEHKARHVALLSGMGEALNQVYSVKRKVPRA